MRIIGSGLAAYIMAFAIIAAIAVVATQRVDNCENPNHQATADLCKEFNATGDVSYSVIIFQRN